jgi:hypothetical protein
MYNFLRGCLRCLSSTTCLERPTDSALLEKQPPIEKLQMLTCLYLHSIHFATHSTGQPSLSEEMKIFLMLIWPEVGLMTDLDKCYDQGELAIFHEQMQSLRNRIVLLHTIFHIMKLSSKTVLPELYLLLHLEESLQPKDAPSYMGIHSKQKLGEISKEISFVLYQVFIEKSALESGETETDKQIAKRLNKFFEDLLDSPEEGALKKNFSLFANITYMILLAYVKAPKLVTFTFTYFHYTIALRHPQLLAHQELLTLIHEHRFWSDKHCDDFQQWLNSILPLYSPIISFCPPLIRSLF